MISGTEIDITMIDVIDIDLPVMTNTEGFPPEIHQMLSL